ncbi:MAG: hypothetical protein ACI9WU_004503, partial [Myxococcota bacterium]
MGRALLAVTLLAVIGCRSDATEVPVPGGTYAVVEAPGVADTGDACLVGDETFVKRVLPLLWGRKPASLREVQVLVDLTAELGREGLVRAMARSPEYVTRWLPFLRDVLFVNRAGARANVGCYGDPLRATSGPELATFVRDHAPDAPADAAGGTWNMTDLMRSALLLDDLSPVYRAQLFAQTASVVVPLDDPYEELVSREVYADIFQRAWLNRRMECLACHNSAFSVTDNTDPALDRTWQLPGFFEEALFGQHQGRPEDDLRAFFRISGVLSIVEIPVEEGPSQWAQGEGLAAWGAAEACGRFIPPAEITPDPLGFTGWLVTDHSERATVWELDEHLTAGFDAIRGDVSRVTEPVETTRDGDQSLAWLVGAALSERVWQEATGARLTIANYFPRNAKQRDLLLHLSKAFVGGSFSLVDLLVAVTSHPYYAQSAPIDCPTVASAYYLSPIFDPWVVEVEVEELRGNTQGDALHRHPPRTLLNSVVYALGWAAPAEFFAADPLVEEGEKLPLEGGFHRDIGMFLKDTETGFSGIDLQGTLSWEDAFGSCVDPALFSSEETWTTDELGDDWVRKILDAAGPEHTLRDAVLALKDRLLTDPT